MKKIFLAIAVFIFVPSVWNECFNQSKKTIPTNFLSVFAGVELNTTSMLAGVEFEPVIWKTNRFALGIKGTWIFEHGNGNMIVYVPSGSGSSSFLAVMPTVQYFTFPHSINNRRFFLHSGLGVGWRHESDKGQDYRSLTSFEAGFGLQFDLGAHTNMKWTNTVLFAGRGGIALTKISLGF
ncbi:MAG: hypothetical protein WKF97_11260 [Chitinophagaceae bacterium]